MRTEAHFFRCHHADVCVEPFICLNISIKSQVNMWHISKRQRIGHTSLKFTINLLVHRIYLKQFSTKFFSSISHAKFYNERKSSAIRARCRCRRGTNTKTNRSRTIYCYPIYWYGNYLWTIFSSTVTAKRLTRRKRECSRRYDER